jgi:hypothetical protein
VHTDFTSQYPSVNALLGNANILTAESLSFEDVIEEFRELLANLTFEDAFNPDFWKKLSLFALIKPNADIFPVRAVYNNQTKNIGVNWLSSEEPIWFAGPDVVASVLLTGKIPKIEKAFRIVPHGKQKGLKSTKLRGMITTDPKSEDFFRVVIEQRKLHKSDKALAYFLKILANAGSYGLFVELTPEKQSKTEQIKVFSGQEFFPQPSQVIENHGRWYFPPIGALITAGGRLLLAMLEKCVRDAGGSYLFCDTDSLCIVSSKDGGLVSCPGGEHRKPDGAEAIKALSWEEVRRIAKRFTSLNPYDPAAVPGSILKIEDINFDADGNQRQLYGYAISAKRYALFQWLGDDIFILDPKAHGLGYLLAPKFASEGEQDWTFEAWDYLLRGVLGLQRKEPSWLDIPATMRIILSTPHVLQRLDRSTRPYNFLLCPLIDSVSGYPAGVDPDHFTLMMPFTKDRAHWLDSECINVCDGKVYRLSLIQTEKLDKAIPQTMSYVLRLYPRHPEAKSLAPDGQLCSADSCGLLKRAFVIAGTFRFVGKETDRRWEQGEDLSLMTFSPIDYSLSGKMAAADAALLKAMAKHSMRELIRKTGLSQHTLEAIRSGKLVRVRTLAILKRALESVKA